MKQSKVQELVPGLYVITWKRREGGGDSLAAVGVTEDGTRWLAPCDWVLPTECPEVWRMIAEAALFFEG